MRTAFTSPTGFASAQTGLIRQWVACGTLLVSLLVTACAAGYKVPIETPTRATLDISAFQSILVAGFIAGGTTAIDTNVETVRLVRSQLRSKTSLKVIDAEVLPVGTLAGNDAPRASARDAATIGSQHTECSRSPKNENDLAACQRVFANVALWRRLGEEYQNALIVTGTLLFAPMPRGGSLQATFVFIDSRTGGVLHREVFRENVSSGGRRYVPALSTYFRLMDRVLPRFLGALADQHVGGTRTLLR